MSDRVFTLLYQAELIPSRGCWIRTSDKEVTLSCTTAHFESEGEETVKDFTSAL